MPTSSELFGCPGCQLSSPIQPLSCFGFETLKPQIRLSPQVLSLLGKSSLLNGGAIPLAMGRGLSFRVWNMAPGRCVLFDVALFAHGGWCSSPFCPGPPTTAKTKGGTAVSMVTDGVGTTLESTA